MRKLAELSERMACWHFSQSVAYAYSAHTLADDECQEPTPVPGACESPVDRFQREIRLGVRTVRRRARTEAGREVAAAALSFAAREGYQLNAMMPSMSALTAAWVLFEAFSLEMALAT